MEQPPLTNTPEKPIVPEHIHAAYEDALTGLPNRRWLDEHLPQTIEEYPGNFGVLFLDVDGLKQKNDVHGHEAGDQLIKDTGHIMQDSLRHPHDDRPGDNVSRVAARLAGDEFFAVLVGVHSQTELDAAKHRIQSNLAEQGINASIGGLVHTNETATELLSKADTLMYEQKQARKQQKQVEDDAALVAELSPEQLETAQQVGALLINANLDSAVVHQLLRHLERQGG